MNDAWASRNCTTHPAPASFVAGPTGVAYFTTCYGGPPGWTTTLRYIRSGKSQETHVLRFPGPPPSMLGFDGAGRLTWATTRQGMSQDATSTLASYWLDPTSGQPVAAGSIELQEPSNLVNVVEGDRCWLIQTDGAKGARDLVIVPRQDGEMTRVPGDDMRALFWDSGGAAFVVGTSTRDVADHLRAIGCDGKDRPLRASLKAALSGVSRFTTYLSSPRSALVLVTRITDDAADAPATTWIVRTKDDARLSPRDLIGVTPTRFNDFAVSADSAWSAIAADDGIHLLHLDRHVRTLPINYGWSDGLAFTHDGRELAVYRDFGVHLIGMEN